MNRLLSNSQLLNEFFPIDFKNIEFLSPSSFKTEKYPFSTISESLENSTIEIIAPGFSKKDINLSTNMVNNSLVLSVEGKTDKKEEKSNKYVATSFKKEFVIPSDIVIENITAKCELGILTITIPKEEKKKVDSKRTISIQ